MSIKKLELKLEDPKKYYAISHKLGIAQICTKDLQEKLFGLECNFEEFNGIDFKKGCYVGQENKLARMKLKNKIRKDYPIEKDDVKSGSEISFENENIGKVLYWWRHLALIKFGEHEKNYIGEDLTCDGFNIKLISQFTTEICFPIYLKKIHILQNLYHCTNVF